MIHLPALNPHMRNLPALNPLLTWEISQLLTLWFFLLQAANPGRLELLKVNLPLSWRMVLHILCRVSLKVFQRLQCSKLVHKWLVWKVRSSRCYSRDGVLTVLWWCSYLVWFLSRHSIPPCALVFNWKLSHLYKRTLSYATTYAWYYWFSLPGVHVEVGSEVVCCMLDVNWSESCIIVSLNPKLTEGHDATEQKGKSSKRGKRRKQTLVTMG